MIPQNKVISLLHYVVTLVNYILSPESSSVDETTYDVDGNGSVNITDVVALVNIILTNN